VILVNSSHPVLAITAALVHAILAVGCVVAWNRDKRTSRTSNLWISLAILQLFFAVDAGIGLRLLIADLGRQYFLHHGWYGRQRPVQVALTLTAFFTVSVVTSRWLLSFRQTSRASRLAIGGSGVLMAFFLMATISLHDTESFAHAVFGKILGCSLTAAGIWLAIQDQTSAGG
jgi:hypothetical protein